MMNKINEKMLKDAVKQIDPLKLSKIKKSLESSSDFADMLRQLDPQKAQKTLNSFVPENSVSAEEISKLIAAIKQNPDMLKDLKNHL